MKRNFCTTATARRHNIMNQRWWREERRDEEVEEVQVPGQLQWSANSTTAFPYSSLTGWMDERQGRQGGPAVEITVNASWTGNSTDQALLKHAPWWWSFHFPLRYLGSSSAFLCNHQRSRILYPNHQIFTRLNRIEGNLLRVQGQQAPVQSLGQLMQSM